MSEEGFSKVYNKGDLKISMSIRSFISGFIKEYQKVHEEDEIEDEEFDELKKIMKEFKINTLDDLLNISQKGLNEIKSTQLLNDLGEYIYPLKFKNMTIVPSSLAYSIYEDYYCPKQFRSYNRYCRDLFEKNGPDIKKYNDQNKWLSDMNEYYSMIYNGPKIPEAPPAPPPSVMKSYYPSYVGRKKKKISKRNKKRSSRKSKKKDRKRSVKSNKKCYLRKSYTRKDGVKVKATYVKCR